MCTFTRIACYLQLSKIKTFPETADRVHNTSVTDHWKHKGDVSVCERSV